MRPKLRLETKGFTLIEVLIVVVIVGILVAIAHAALRTTKSDASTVKVTAALRKVDEAKIRYYMDTRDAGAPTLPNLVQYMQAPAGSGEEIFYSKTGWEAGHPSKSTAGLLLQGAVGQKAVISPNARDIPATLSTW